MIYGITSADTAYTHKSQCLDRLGRVPEALQTCLSAEEYALENPYYYTLKGVYLEKNGKVEDAHNAYQKSFMLFLMPVTFTGVEKKDVLDFFKKVGLAQAKQKLLGKTVDTRKKIMNAVMNLAGKGTQSQIDYNQ